MTAKPPVVLLLMRAESLAGHSIERVFETVAPLLSGNFEVRVVRVPCQSRGILRCARNLIFTARQRADIIHVTGDIHYCALAVRRKRCVLTIHDFRSLYRLKGIRKLIFSTLWYSLPLRWAPYVTVISGETRRQLEHYFPAAAGKVEVILNCVDGAFKQNYRTTRTGTSGLRVLQIGTGRNKNLERVAAAASGLPLRLRIIGPLSGSQRSLLSSLDLDWASAQQLSGEEMVKEYEDSDLLVFASTYEGFGLPVVEAQAIGLPVITSNIAPMTEIAGDAALYVDPYDEKEIRAALKKILRSPHLARLLSDRGRRNAERFDPKTVAERYADVYARTRRRPSPRGSSRDLGSRSWRHPPDMNAGWRKQRLPCRTRPRDHNPVRLLVAAARRQPSSSSPQPLRRHYAILYGLIWIRKVIIAGGRRSLLGLTVWPGVHLHPPRRADHTRGLRMAFILEKLA